MSNADNFAPTLAIFGGDRIARDQLGVLGIGLCGLACASNQWLGVVIGVVVVLVGFPTTSIVAFTLGQLGLIAAAPTAQLAFWGGQLGLLLVVSEPLRNLPLADRGWQVGTTTVVIATFVVLAVVAGVLLPNGLWVAVTAIVGLVASGVYIAHRYTLLRLGLVDLTSSHP